MRVALVSPYSWTYPGGVARHVEGLATELLAAGHDVRVLAPLDPPGRTAALLHRGIAPQQREIPDWLVPLGGTVGWPSNGAISNLAITPRALTTLRHELATGGFDVVHVHEPVAPVMSWDALTYARAPLVGTFHCYSEARAPHAVAVLAGARRKLNRLHVRIAVSEAAEWTARRFYGGRYRIIPNAVAVAPEAPPAPRAAAPGDPLRLVFVGQAVERKGLPILLRAFEALRAEVPATLTVVGSESGELAPLVMDMQGITALGRASEADKRQALSEADVLCAPSLGGESFGIVLAEAFAAGRPVVASDIAGYRDVVSHGHDGLLVAPGDPVALAETLRELALSPDERVRLARNAARTAERYAWPHVAEQVTEAYEDALAVPRPDGALARAAVAVGARPADGRPPVRAERLESLELPATGERRRPRARRRLAAAGGVAALAACGYLALDHVGWEPVGDALLHSSPVWVLVALALMCLSMGLRAVSWHAILRAAVPDARPRLGDAFQGTAIGVLMSATLPARLGEPSRALIVARRLGDARGRMPVVLGTLISQTLLNLLALVILGAVMLSTVGLFDGRQQALLWYALAPFAALCAVLVAPALLRSGMPSRSARVAGWIAAVRAALSKVRWGLRVFRSPRLGAVATSAQLAAWALQWLSCSVLFVALGMEEQAGLGAAAAVLFAVNVTAVLPVMPSNLGVFQAACVAVLAGAYGVPAAQALGYGIVLQAVELATAVVLGAPALVKEGVSWREVRLRALHSTPVSLSPRRAALKADA
jgi:phosphatidylinositol alpha-mannosyltransferase